jgi:proline iminopeptidase
MRARLRDTELYFDVDGAGLVAQQDRMHERPTAFVIHGGPGGDHSELKCRFGPLKDKMQVVYFDHRGHGRSARGDPEKYTLDQNVEDMEALREHLGVRQIVSIGNSYGGMVAMAHAARYPRTVSHLVLVVTAAHAGFIARSRQIVAERGTVEQGRAVEDLWEGRLDTPEKHRRYFEIMGPLYARHYDHVLAQRSLDRGILSFEPLNRAYAPDGTMREFDLRPELKNISAPTLIIAGRHDWICAPEFSEEMHALIPNSDLRILEDSSHAVGADEPVALLDAIVGFVIYGSRRSSHSAPD